MVSYYCRATSSEIEKYLELKKRAKCFPFFACVSDFANQKSRSVGHLEQCVSLVVGENSCRVRGQTMSDERISRTFYPARHSKAEGGDRTEPRFVEQSISRVPLCL